jgi:hypothetical protein
VQQNLPNVGKLIFLLVGAVDDNIEVSVPLRSSLYPHLKFVPTNEELVTVREKTIEVNGGQGPGRTTDRAEERAAAGGTGRRIDSRRILSRRRQRDRAVWGDPARDAQAFADVLRIAYNFASDLQKLITLLVSRNWSSARSVHSCA